jgi:putative transcriptional regulator
MIQCHPSDTTLLGAAAGSLPEPHRRVLAVHLAQCPDCAERLREMETLGGALLDALPAAAMAPDALARVMAQLNDVSKMSYPDVLPAPVSLQSLATGRWRWSGPGIAIMSLISRDATNSRLDLIRVASGAALLEHRHTAFETTVVLTGAFEDGHQTFAVGDFAEADGETEHRPHALPGETCICLIATTGHLSTRGLLGRLVRPLLGM